MCQYIVGKVAIQRLGYEVTISNQSSVVLGADKLFLPGVGMLAKLQNLQNLDLVDLVKKSISHYFVMFRDAVTWFFFTRKSTERVAKSALSWALFGEVNLLDTGSLPLPHMGWNTADAVEEYPLLKELPKIATFILFTVLRCQLEIIQWRKVNMVNLLVL